MGSTKQQGSSPNMPIYVYLWTNLSFPRCSLGDSEYTVKYCSDLTCLVLSLLRTPIILLCSLAPRPRSRQICHQHCEATRFSWFHRELCTDVLLQNLLRLPRPWTVEVTLKRQECGAADERKKEILP